MGTTCTSVLLKQFLSVTQWDFPLLQSMVVNYWVAAEVENGSVNKQDIIGVTSLKVFIDSFSNCIISQSYCLVFLNSLYYASNISLESFTDNNIAYLITVPLGTISRHLLLRILGVSSGSQHRFSKYLLREKRKREQPGRSPPSLMLCRVSHRQWPFLTNQTVISIKVVTMLLYIHCKRSFVLKEYMITEESKVEIFF